MYYLCLSVAGRTFRDIPDPFRYSPWDTLR
jgi:hypothetical protein